MQPYPVYNLFPVTIIRGKGCYVYDKYDNRYLDLYGGHAVISIGHAHPRYIEAITHQIAKIGFYSNSVINPLQEEFARKLGEACGYPDHWLFLVNSGAEANENAIKLASFITQRTRIIAAKGAFHGRTSMAVEATDNTAIMAPVNANNHVTHLPLNDTASWVKEIERGDVAAVIIECIQGVGGIRMAEESFVEEIRKACDSTGTILIFDEIQCGYGRTGRFFAHQWLASPEHPNGIPGDIITIAKGIANGMPMGAILISPRYEAVKGRLGTTFGGNHLACAAALSVLDVIKDEALIANAHKVGQHIINSINMLRNEHIIDVRGRGLMIGIELDRPYRDIREDLLFNHHIFTGCSGTNTLRLLPPLSLTQEEADHFIKALSQALNH